MLEETIERIKPDIIPADKQLEDSKPWLFKPGESGNPEGRPKDIKYISEAIRERLKTDTKLRDMVVEALIHGVLTGNGPLTKEFLDRGEGKVTDELKVQGELIITPDMRALASRELLEVKTEEDKLLATE